MVIKPSAYRYLSKSSSKKSKTNTLENGGIIENVDYRLITYDIHGNSNDGLYIHQIMPTDIIISCNINSSQEDLIKVLKENQVLTDKATKDNVSIQGEVDLTLFFFDSENNIPLFELQSIENYEKKSNGGDIKGSELLNSAYFKTTASIKNEIDVKPEGSQPTEVVKNEPDNKEGNNSSGELVLPSYDNTQESVLKQHLNGDEIYSSHLSQILQRKLKYEEVIGTIRLRKCFMKPYYKVIK